MALGKKKSGIIHNLNERDVGKLEEKYDEGLLADISIMSDDHPHLAALVYQIELMQQDIDELRRFTGIEQDGRIDNVVQEIDKINKEEKKK
jgi:hypothetical protein